jgi:hypothetical protein
MVNGMVIINKDRDPLSKPRAMDSARMRAIAAQRRGRGHVQVACRRALIAADGKPVRMRDFLARAYPRAEAYSGWMRWSVMRALPAVAVRLGHMRARGAPTLYVPNAELRRRISPTL